MDPIDFKSDDFSDIIRRDDRYDARAYALLADVIKYLSREGADGASGERHFGSEEILEEFKERALDQYGPMTYAVLTAWGLSRTEDIGEMMENLVESRRIGRDEGDSIESFAGAYDFTEVFLGPFRT